MDADGDDMAEGFAPADDDSLHLIGRTDDADTLKTSWLAAVERSRVAIARSRRLLRETARWVSRG